MTRSSITKRQTSHCIFLIQFAAILTLFLCACGEGYHGDSANMSEKNGSAALNIQWYDASGLEDSRLTTKAAVLNCQAGGVDYVVCEVYDEAGEHLATGGPWPCAAGSGEIDYIPAGSARTFVALAEDTDGNILYHGQTFDITIRADQYVDDIFIDAYPFIPDLTFPADGDYVDPNGFTFSWQSLENADQYIIQVAEDSTFENPVLDDTTSNAMYIPGTLLPSTEYFWRIFAVDLFTNIGAESEIRSFVTSDCTYAISSDGNAFGPDGGSGDFTIESSADNCSWAAVPSDDWITLTADVSGSGAGYISYNIDPNTSSNERTGTIIAGGQVHAITQDGLDCTYAISPAGDSFTSQGGAGTIQVISTADDCPWDAVSDVGWITISSGGSGSGNGTVGYQVAANTTATQRRGVITVGGQAHTITQEGLVQCTYQIYPANGIFSSDADTGTIQVTSQDGCAWRAVSSAAWAVVASGASGSGNGTVGYRISANLTATERRAIITVGGQTHTIIQAGLVECTYQIAPATGTFTFDAGTGTIQVITETGCDWSAVSQVDWITITSEGSGSGGGIVGYQVEENTEEEARTGVITIQGRNHTVTQAGPEPVNQCSATIQAGSNEPHSQDIEMGQTSGTFQFDYDHYSVADRTIVSYEGSVLYDTGCIGSNNTLTLSYSGSSTLIHVQVVPNCAGSSSTGWEYTVGCPE